MMKSHQITVKSSRSSQFHCNEVILSSADQQGKSFRSVLRGSRGWMNRFLQLGGVGSLRWTFAVYPRSDQGTLHVDLEEENDLHKDMLILPASGPLELLDRRRITCSRSLLCCETFSSASLPYAGKMSL